MDELMKEERFNYLSQDSKGFILAFDREMKKLGYDFGGKIGTGACWGNHMVIYTKSGVKSKTVYARIYMRDSGIVLRLFLNKVDDHIKFIENTPPHIKDVFVGEYADCKHDRDDGDGKCQFRKAYTIDGRLIEKCNGLTFEFNQPTVDKMNDYIALFNEFFAPKKARAAKNY